MGSAGKALSESQRCIFLKPEHPRLRQIQELRKKFDPLAEKIPPHVTLVFPFFSDWSMERLTEIIERVVPAAVIRFSLDAPVADGEFLFFALNCGKSEVESLHDALYSELPPEWRSLEHVYQPHLTFARTTDAQARENAIAEARGVWTPDEGRMTSLVLERIGAMGESVQEYEKVLG